MHAFCLAAKSFWAGFVLQQGLSCAHSVHVQALRVGCSGQGISHLLQRASRKSSWGFNNSSYEALSVPSVSVLSASLGLYC